jgi:hypothetical protein
VIVVRLVAVLLLVALALVLVYFVTRDRRYLTWAWRIFLTAVAAILGLMAFYVIERLFMETSALWSAGGALPS